jgi:signal peptidase I
MTPLNSPIPTPSGKEPWFAANLSLFLPGLGHFYTGDPLRGMGFIVLQILLWGGLLWSFINTALNPIVSALGLIFTAFDVSILGILDVYRCAQRKNSPAFEQLRKQTKDPWLAVFLTRFFFGLGHFYLNKVVVGIFLVALVIAGIFSPILLALNTFLLPSVVAYHAYYSAPVRRDRSRKRIFWVAVILLLPVLLSLLLSIGIRDLVAETRFIPSEAMLPTLQPDDRIVVNKLTYRNQPPERGDIVVFAPTPNLKKLQPKLTDAFIKRIIGLPGEKVEVKQGLVYINNKALAESYIAEKPDYSWGAETVPADSYFVLGDNRNNSYDSHFWGYVPRSNIIGKATKIFYPFDRNRLLEASQK